MELSTIEACKAAGIVRQRFNEFVASGDYPCAPPTIAGKARTFTINDTVALYVFAREIEARTKAINAGMIAGVVHVALSDDPAATACTYAKLSNGRPFVLVESGTAIADEIDGAWILSLTTINIEAIRRVVEAQVSDDHDAGEFIG